MKKKNLKSLENRRRMSGLVMLIPAILYFIIFVYYPIFNLFKLSFYKYDFFSPQPKFVGLQNYTKLLKDSKFKRAFGNTFYFAAGAVILEVGISFFLSIILADVEKKNKALSDFYKIIYFIPYITPMVAISIIWGWLLDPSENGLINYLISFLGISPQSWLFDPKLAMPCLIAISVWQQTGYLTLLFTAGLKDIPQEYYEAAEIDGANAWQRTQYITFPSLRPIFELILIIATLEAFKIFTPMYVLTQGGPVGTTTTIVYAIYQQAFLFSNWGYASAESVCLFVLLFILSMVERKVNR